jgi:hypothetical protein
MEKAKLVPADVSQFTADQIAEVKQLKLMAADVLRA